MIDHDRPLAATGHLVLRTPHARQAAQRLVTVGIRRIVINDAFAVLELRGGTHIVVREVHTAGPHDAPFDLMYDDLAATHALFQANGFSVSEIQDTGGIHKAFTATAPEGFRVRVLNSHVGDRVV